MKIIKTQQDINMLYQARALPAVLLSHVENYLKQLKKELEDVVESEFFQERNGYIVVLEGGDNVRDLSNVGLSCEGSRLLGSCPEYVELLDVGEGLQVYKNVVLNDNDYLMTFFTQARAYDEEVEQWLKDQAERR